MRISTRSIIQGYGRNLNKTLNNMNDARNKVLTSRNFNAISEDPGAASRSFKLRRQYNRNADYIDNVNYIQGLFDSVSSSALDVSGLLSTKVNEDVLRSMNGATGHDSRVTYANIMRGVQESILLSANTVYGDKAVFAGEATDEVPFRMVDDKTGSKVLKYRGIDVNTQDPDELLKLNALTKDTLYVDIGFGMKEDGSGGLISDSAFNMATDGLSLLGYGTNEVEISGGKITLNKNVVMLLGQMADELEKDDGDFNLEKFNKMLDQFARCRKDTADYVANIGIKCEFINNVEKTLTNKHDSINEQLVAVEDIDMPSAITNYVWQQYAYNSALKVGNSILSQSFIDFMR